MVETDDVSANRTSHPEMRPLRLYHEKVCDYTAPHFARSALLIIDVQNDFIDEQCRLLARSGCLPSGRACRRVSCCWASHRARDPALSAGQLGCGRDTSCQHRSGAGVVAPGSPGADIPAILSRAPGDHPRSRQAPCVVNRSSFLFARRSYTSRGGARSIEPDSRLGCTLTRSTRWCRCRRHPRQSK